MNQNLIFWPIIAQALVMLWMYVPMSRARFGAVKSGLAEARDFKLPRQEEPEEIAKFGNAVSNQFELPILFFVVSIAGHSTALIDWPFLVLAWSFVLAKSAHSWIHMTSNRLMLRFRLFALAWSICVLMWVWFAIRLALV